MKRKEMPQIGSDEWKTFVADAIAKRPARRTAAEREAIKTAIAYERSSATPGEKKPELVRAQSAVDFGRLYGYSEDDIACFYLKRRRGRADIAYSEYIRDCRRANFRPLNANPEK
jgi:hypothetical protein